MNAKPVDIAEVEARYLEALCQAQAQRDALLAALDILFTVIASVDTVYETETGRTIEQDFAQELDRAREVL